MVATYVVLLSLNTFHKHLGGAQGQVGRHVPQCAPPWLCHWQGKLRSAVNCRSNETKLQSCKCDCYWNMCKKNAERLLIQLNVISILVSHFSEKLDCLRLLKLSSKILFCIQTFMSGYPGCSPYQLATVGLIMVSFQYHDHQTSFQCLKHTNAVLLLNHW